MVRLQADGSSYPSRKINEEKQHKKKKTEEREKVIIDCWKLELAIN